MCQSKADVGISRSNVDMLIESRYRPFYTMKIVMFTLCFTVWEIFSVDMCSTLTFIMGQGQMQICQSKRHFLMVLQWYCLFYTSQFTRCSPTKCARSWPWHLEWAKVKCRYGNRKATCDFLCVGNSNVCPTRHRLRIPKYSIRFSDLENEGQGHRRSDLIWSNLIKEMSVRTYCVN